MWRTRDGGKEEPLQATLGCLPAPPRATLLEGAGSTCRSWETPSPGAEAAGARSLEPGSGGSGLGGGGGLAFGKKGLGARGERRVGNSAKLLVCKLLAAGLRGGSGAGAGGRNTCESGGGSVEGIEAS